MGRHTAEQRRLGTSSGPVRIGFGPGTMKIFMLLFGLLLWMPAWPDAAFAAHGNGRQPAQDDPAQLRIDEGKHLGARIDSGYPLKDASGNQFTLGDMLGKPLILVLSYYTCDGACTTMNRNLKEALAGMEGLEMDQDYRVLTLSFDRHDNSERLRMFMQHAGFERQALDGWRLAIFQETKDIARFTEALGYSYFWSPRDALFLHPNVYILLSAEGRVMRYLYGSSIDSKEMEIAIIRADNNKTAPANVVNFLLATCYSYNFQDGKYAISYSLFIAIGAMLLGAAMVLLGALTVKRRRRRECQ